MLTDIDPKALEHACLCAGRSVHHFDRMALDLPLRASIVAHARAIEQHEAFKQQVSDLVADYVGYVPPDAPSHPIVNLIIAKPDHVQDALEEVFAGDSLHIDCAKELRAALAARGLEIREVDHGR